MSQPVMQREYKSMLKIDRFAGGPEGDQGTADVFWKVFSESIHGVIPKVKGSLGEKIDERQIRFFDTDAHHLERASYIFRERIEDEKTEITLKFRHPDRFLSQGQSDALIPKDKNGSGTKFEEDIKLGFRSLYSFSTTQKVEEGFECRDLGSLAMIFPGLAKCLEPVDSGATLKTANNFVAFERVLKGGSFQIGDGDRYKVKCALIFWRDSDGTLLAVEFSFNYASAVETEKGKGKWVEDLPPGPAGIAFEVFKVFDPDEGAMKEWVDPDANTKTQIALKG